LLPDGGVGPVRLIEGDVIGVQLHVVLAVLGEAPGLVVELLVEDGAELDLEVDLIEFWL
jgi:hypothetical protein